MSEQPQSRREPRQRSRAGIVAGLAVLVAFAALGLSIYGVIKQSANAPLEIQLPHVIAVGSSMAIATFIATFRNMGGWDILEAVCDAVLLLFSLIGAVLRGIWNAILSLFGWD